MARWRKVRDSFPSPLAEFVAAEWLEPVEGECLDHYACWGRGYGEDCAPRPGEWCGQQFYEAYPRHAAAQREKDARARWRKARLSWLGEDHPDYEAESTRQLVEDP